MASIQYTNDDGEEIFLNVTGKTIEEIDTLATKIKRSLYRKTMTVDYEGAAT